jgi:hypothetical protein
LPDELDWIAELKRHFKFREDRATIGFWRGGMSVTSFLSEL